MPSPSAINDAASAEQQQHLRFAFEKPGTMAFVLRASTSSSHSLGISFLQIQITSSPGVRQIRMDQCKPEVPGFAAIIRSLFQLHLSP
ncbi:MAG: hypothetical protein MZU84_02335 [Sphingobacterium sp.]|nr:hypothetical protein [Sphingobacterium sp.]